jgi:hypothetical protein
VGGANYGSASAPSKGRDRTTTDEQNDQETQKHRSTEIERTILAALRRGGGAASRRYGNEYIKMSTEFH